MQTIKVTLSSAELLSLNATPIAVLPAPGANKMYEIQDTLTIYHAGSIPYTLDPDGSSLILGDQAKNAALWDVSDNTGLLDQTVDTVYPNGGSDQLASPLSVWENQPVYVFENAGVPMTLGNGTATLVIYYTIANVT